MAANTPSKNGGSYDTTTGVASSSVDYAKSFRLRYAGNSTMRKERTNLRERREDEENYTDDEEDETFELRNGDGEDGAAPAQTELDAEMQEARIKLNMRKYTINFYA